MDKTEKLLIKLFNGTIKAKEARTLLKRLGWSLNRIKGSHEIWSFRQQTLVVATHDKELKDWLIVRIQKALEPYRRNKE